MCKEDCSCDLRKEVDKLKKALATALNEIDELNEELDSSYGFVEKRRPRPDRWTV